MDALPIPSLGASAINASTMNTMHGQKCIACDECCGLYCTANAVLGVCSMSGLRTRTRSRNRVIPLQSTRLYSHVHFFPLFFPWSPLGRKWKGEQLTASPSGRVTHARSATEPTLLATLFLFFSSYPFCYAARPRYSGRFYSLLLSPPPTLPLLSLICLVFERTCETKGFSLRYTEPLELLNPPLAAFSFSRVGIQENKCRPLPLEVSLLARYSFAFVLQNVNSSIMQRAAIFLTFPTCAVPRFFFNRGKRRKAGSNLLKAGALTLRYTQKKMAKSQTTICIVGKLKAETLTNSPRTWRFSGFAKRKTVGR